MSKTETLRRLRRGDLQKVMRSRYGYTLPDDDAGREDLYEMLLPISLGPVSRPKMQNAVEVWAPWMAASEAGQLLDRINLTPPYLRKPTGRELGERLRLTNQEREALGLRTIQPFDMTDEQLTERRKAKDRARKQRKRLEAGSKTREVYLTNSLSQQKPWESEGISRRTWERRRQNRSGAGLSCEA